MVYFQPVVRAVDVLKNGLYVKLVIGFGSKR
jgi:hypothetical protein